jgi:hypothetical protein
MQEKLGTLPAGRVKAIKPTAIEGRAAEETPLVRLMRLRRNALVFQVEHALHEERTLWQRKGVLKIRF